jgi:PST family polysaccharide transporter
VSETQAIPAIAAARAYGPAVATTGGRTYETILRSSALIGLSSVATIAVGIVRTKAIALLLGPAGVGLLGLYGSVADLAQNIAGLGINSSGVRQIAEAVGSGDAARLARTAAVLRRLSFALGALGALVLIAFSTGISSVTFGSDGHAVGVALLGVAVLLRCIASGQVALLQGTRRIHELSMVGVVGAALGALATILIIYALGEHGVVPSLVAVSAIGVATAWWYTRTVPLETPVMTPGELRHEARALLALGLAFLASGFMTLGVAYAVRATVLRAVGIEAAGLYQAAWAVGGLYVGIILQAMGTDFYPRLTAVARNNPECNRLVNEQAEVSLLLAGPGVIATLTLAPVIIALLYSPSFGPAVDGLRWICLGMMLRVITWPMGFIVLAKGAQRIFFLTELAWTVVHVGLALIFVHSHGLNGAGMAFFGSYVFHGLLIYPVVRRLSGFRWSDANRRTGLLFLGLIGLVFAGYGTLPIAPASSLGVLALGITTVYSLRRLLRLIALERLPRSITRVLVACGLAPSEGRR